MAKRCVGLGPSAAEAFAATFEALNKYVGRGIKSCIKVNIYNTFKGDVLPDEVKGLHASDHY